MSKDKRTYQTITEAEIRAYLEGKLSGKEAHAFERRVLNDPFAQEAMEGLEGQPAEAIREDLQMMKHRVARRTRTVVPWMRMAAVGALLMVSVWAAWMIMDETVAPQQVTMKSEEQPAAAKDSAEVPQPKPVEESEVEKNTESVAANSAGESTEAGPAPAVTEREDTPAPQPIVEQEEAHAAGQGISGQGGLALTDQLAEDHASGGQQPFRITERDEKEQVEATEEMALYEALDEDEAPADDRQISDAGKAATRKEKAEEVGRARSKKTSGAAITEDFAPAAADRAVSNKVSGKVTWTEDEEPLPGVNVLVKGTPIGALTDVDGYYEIEAPEGTTLVFSFIGMIPEEVKVGDQEEVNVEMKGDHLALSEVVVIGYGTQKKSDLTGAFSRISSDEISGNQDYKGPVPVGGVEAFKEYVDRNLKYPTAAMEAGVEGKVVVKISLSASGSITGMEVKKSLGYGCDEEALRLIREGPEWQPASRGGENMESTVRVRIGFGG